MRTDVIGRNLEITPAIQQYAEQKTEKLLRVCDGTQQIRVVAEERKHNEFHVEIITEVVKHEDFVSHASGDDLYLAIDSAVEKNQRQLRDHKERLKAH